MKRNLSFENLEQKLYLSVALDVVPTPPVVPSGPKLPPGDGTPLPDTPSTPGGTPNPN